MNFTENQFIRMKGMAIVAAIHNRKIKRR